VFNSIYGNEAAKNKLLLALKREALGSSLLFQGQDGIGKILFAEIVARYLVTGDPFYPNNHPDIYIFRPEGKSGMHSIESIRNFCETVSLAPFQGKRKVLLLPQAERMLPYSANALLKTLEEPALNTYIILLTDQPERLLLTIKSRLWKLSFQPLMPEEISRCLQKEHGVEETLAKQWGSLAGGSLSRALELAKDKQNSFHSELFEILCKMGFSSYAELKNVCEFLGKELDLQKSRIQQEFLDETLCKMPSAEDLSAAARAQIQKQVEGNASLCQSHIFNYIFEQILFWWRDLALLKVGGSESLVYHKLHLENLKAFVSKRFIPLSQVETHILDAKLSLERGIPSSSVMETLFLKLF